MLPLVVATHVPPMQLPTLGWLDPLMMTSAQEDCWALAAGGVLLRKLVGPGTHQLTAPGVHPLENWPLAMTLMARGPLPRRVDCSGSASAGERRSR
ncbi:hypothetical protein CYMTET_6800 [Cymbomonas tetramitiformis]|uniref:Uncharacterized protein n=1 Tax=Cymbomonas tetramitiformis TaxID=36881 RepID=A0AAE0LHQ3_9CHLO|nr:hypothetical protein CYMTET_6800 [Cymbomonas tetramitiformis]